MGSGESIGNVSKKAWGGRFQKAPDEAVEKFTASIGFDYRLFEEDISGSLAHASMLARQGIISSSEEKALRDGLLEILQEIKEGKFEFKQEFEDIHMNIEQRLIQKVGPVGGKLHTARSRNDQVALDERLYVLKEIETLSELISSLQRAILEKSREHLGAVMPGFTHLQHAQPILFSHHFMAYFWMLQRDKERLEDVKKRASVSPLGAGALAGTTFPVDPEYTASALGLARSFSNSIDAVSDRDHLVELMSAAAISMMHLSRLCEELVLWSTHEFGFVEMDDSFSTGSSIMPQKKNPDVAELVRGKTGRVYGNLIALLTVMKGLPLAYHSDMQEDKEALFDTVDTWASCLKTCAGMIKTLKVNRAKMRSACDRDHSNATEVADYLAGKGIPFREAHHVTGRLVRYALDKDCSIQDLSLEELRQFSPVIGEDIYPLLTPESCVERRNSPGGTSTLRVAEELEKAAALLETKAKA